MFSSNTDQFISFLLWISLHVSTEWSVISNRWPEYSRWGGLRFSPAEPWSLANQGDYSHVRCQCSMCISSCFEMLSYHNSSILMLLGMDTKMAGCTRDVYIFLHAFNFQNAMGIQELSPTQWQYKYMCVCFSDLAGDGSGWGSRCDTRQGAELWHHLAGEGEDHRASIQKPTLLPEAQGWRCHSGWV